MKCAACHQQHCRCYLLQHCSGLLSLPYYQFVAFERVYLSLSLFLHHDPEPVAERARELVQQASVWRGRCMSNCNEEPEPSRLRFQMGLPGDNTPILLAHLHALPDVPR
ncbi:hypothetical protein CGLAMM_10605 [Acetobacteraceae bacterium EV16G]